MEGEDVEAPTNRSASEQKWGLNSREDAKKSGNISEYYRSAHAIRTVHSSSHDDYCCHLHDGCPLRHRHAAAHHSDALQVLPMRPSGSKTAYAIF